MNGNAGGEEGGSGDSSHARNGQVPGRAEEDGWIGLNRPLAKLIALRTMTFSANSSPVALEVMEVRFENVGFCALIAQAELPRISNA